jgi:ectoine hydroxylase-related dioxygenase (phytanoyl-CoA dioxygenase family)
MTPPCHLLAAWIALKDVGPRCVPLLYVPGSHGPPYYQYEPGPYIFNHDRYGDAEAQAAADWDREQCDRAGVEEKLFTCQLGDVPIWHHSLLHGGAPSEDASLTRRSFVVHFSTLVNMKVVRNTYQTAGSTEILAGGRVLEGDGCRGFESLLAVAARRKWLLITGPHR